MCVSNLMLITMANEDENLLNVMYGADGIEVSTSYLQDVSNPEFEDVFKGIDFDCSSELSSLSNEEEDSSKPSETQIRKHLVVGKHIEIIDGEHRKYKCTICKCQFSWKHQIRYHDYCVTGKRPLKCELCDKRFVKKSHLVYHTRTHSGESPYKCSICPKTFKQLDKLKRHEKIHKERGKDDKFQCNVCKKHYCDRDSLRKHELKHDKTKTYQCKYCKKKYVDKFTLKQHLASHQLPKFICEVCGRRFRRKNSLNIHLQMHEDLYPYQCSQCRKTFRTRKELNQHNVVHDKNNPGFECSLCSVMCGRKDNLLRHVRNCHLDPCIKKEQKPKKTTEESQINDLTKEYQKNDLTEGQNLKNMKDYDHVKESRAVTAKNHSSLTSKRSQTSSLENSGKTGLPNEGSRVKKKTCAMVGKKLSSEQKGKSKRDIKKETRKLKRSGTITNESTEVTEMASGSCRNIAEQVQEVEPENSRGDRKSVVITTSTLTEVPVDLSQTESPVTRNDQDKDFHAVSGKTSVIVHTSSFHGSLLHEANSRREPVIKLFRTSTESKSLVSDPT